ncbi:ArsR family transcriptional regulator [Haloplanus litoreus]|uniref:ArsR family transcriptional regulator n=1 Tax=Haloplanus litoreus TaxID=767515 RepID=UPI00360BF406
MAKDRDEESGRYREVYSVESFLKALRQFDGAAGTQEIADEVGCEYRTAHGKLTDMEQEGVITSRKVGNANLWMLVDDD